jgi:hypothetical protein
VCQVKPVSFNGVGTEFAVVCAMRQEPLAGRAECVHSQAILPAPSRQFHFHNNWDGSGLLKKPDMPINDLPILYPTTRRSLTAQHKAVFRIVMLLRG